MTRTEQEIEELAGDLIGDPRVQRMKRFIQHGRVTTFEHSLHVARLALLLTEKLGIHADKRSLVRTAILHDYYLYDWHDHHDHLHGCHHPFIASRNAKRDFHITPEEQAMIESHMWPLTLRHLPHGREAWILTLADKIASMEETLWER